MFIFIYKLIFIAIFRPDRLYVSAFPGNFPASWARCSELPSPCPCPCWSSRSRRSELKHIWSASLGLLGGSRRRLDHVPAVQPDRHVLLGLRFFQGPVPLRHPGDRPVHRHQQAQHVLAVEYQGIFQGQQRLHPVLSARYQSPSSTAGSSPSPFPASSKAS